jgi:hypothetical protein
MANHLCSAITAYKKWREKVMNNCFISLAGEKKYPIITESINLARKIDRSPFGPGGGHFMRQS